jgi:hypothetical protein
MARSANDVAIKNVGDSRRATTKMLTQMPKAKGISILTKGYLLQSVIVQIGLFAFPHFLVEGAGIL